MATQVKDLLLLLSTVLDLLCSSVKGFAGVVACRLEFVVFWVAIC